MREDVCIALTSVTAAPDPTEFEVLLRRVLCVLHVAEVVLMAPCSVHKDCSSRHCSRTSLFLSYLWRFRK